MTSSIWIVMIEGGAGGDDTTFKIADDVYFTSEAKATARADELVADEVRNRWRTAAGNAAVATWQAGKPHPIERDATLKWLREMSRVRVEASKAFVPPEVTPADIEAYVAELDADPRFYVLELKPAEAQP